MSSRFDERPVLVKPLVASLALVALLAVAPSGAPHHYVVRIVDFAYQPARLAIRTGDSVTFVNEDAVAHTVTTEGGNAVDSGPIDHGKSWTMTFTHPGRYDYSCDPHPYMRGSVEVSP
jgi:plastocyanin